MPTKLELIQEAYKRGILPKDKVPLYEEAVKRGLLKPSAPADIPVPILAEEQVPGVSRLLDDPGTDSATAQRLRNTGITPGTATEFAGLHIQREAAQGRQLDPNQQVAIQDIYKQAAGRGDVSNKDFFQAQRAQTLAGRRETIGGRFVDAGAAYVDRLFAQPGLNVLGTVAPDLANDLGENVELAYATDPNSWAAKYGGGLAGEIVKTMAVNKVLPGLGVAVTYGGTGFGETRRDVAERRDGGQQISTADEFKAAIGVGGAEALSGYIGNKIFHGMGNALKGPITGGMRPFVRQALSLFGGAFAEGTEEAITQLVENKIRQGTYDPRQALTEGMTEAFLTGMLIAPFGAGAVNSRTDTDQQGAGFPVQQVPPADHIGDANNMIPPAQPAAVDHVADAGNMVAEPVAPQQAEQVQIASADPATQQPQAESDPQNVPEAQELPGELPAVPQEGKKAEILKFAAEHGYDTMGLENVGRRIILAKLGEQAAERAKMQQRQLPPGAETWDAGRLRRFAKANGYTVDEAAVDAMIDHGAKPRQAVRAVIEGQYRLAPGEGPAGETPRIAPKTAAAVTAPQNQAAPAPKAQKPARLPAPTKTAGGKDILPPKPRGNRKMSFSKLKGWASKAKYKVGKLHNLNALHRGITQQRSNSMIDLPRTPKAARGWNFRRFKAWAKHVGFNVDQVKTRRDLMQEMAGQRKAAIKTARQEAKAARSGRTLMAEPDRDVIRKELWAAKKQLREEQIARRTDPLTGAPNQVQYEEDAARIFKEADAKKESVAIVETDVGGLKVMNTVYGHAGGDEMLKMAHEAMAAELRMPPQKDRPADYPGSAAYRIGGDEFPAILRDVRDQADVKAAMDRINERFDKDVAEKFPDLPAEARPFIAFNAVIRKPGDTRPVKDMRKEADEGVEAAKSKVKAKRKVPEGRTELLAYIEEHKAALARGRTAIAKAVPIGGTSHKRRVPMMIEHVLTPIASRVRDISPRMFDRLMRMEFKTGVARERLRRELSGPATRITESLGGKGSEKYGQWKLHVLNGDRAEAKALLPESRHEDFDQFYAMRRSLLKDQQDAGVKIGDLGEDSWPRYIRDYKAFDKVFGDDMGRFEDAWELARQVKGRRLLTAEEKADIANSVIAGYGPIKFGSFGPTHARERSIETLSAEQAEHYIDPFEAAFRYIDGATYAAERARFLGKSDDLSKLGGTIGKLVQEDVDAGKLSKDGQQELIDLLTVRFTADMLVTHKAVRTFKQMVHLLTLGQFRSAINQLTDVAITATTQGIGPTIKGARTAAGLGPADQRLLMEDIGIHSHGEEFKDVGRIAKLADRVLKMTGFIRIDRFGKETLINAAYESMQAAAKNPESAAYKRLERDYRPVLGDKFDGTVKALRDGTRAFKNEDRDYLLFLELSKIQPVTMSQMPAAYLKSPNGRIMYTLKTFTVMQLDLVRRQMLRKLATPGQRREGLEMLSAYIVLFGLVGFGKELLIDLLRGKEISADQIPDRAVESLLATLGTNRYTSQPLLDLIPDTAKEAVGLSTDSRSSTPTQAALNLIAPPTSWIDAGWSDLTNAGDGQGLRSPRFFPVVGELVYYHAPFGRGSQLNREEANVDYRERLKNLWREAYFARQSGDTETAAFLLRVYNDRRKQGPGDGRIKPLVFADLSTLPTTSSERREKQQTKADAVEAARAGRTDEARDLLAEYNEGRGRKFAYSGLLEAARRSE